MLAYVLCFAKLVYESSYIHVCSLQTKLKLCCTFVVYTGNDFQLDPSTVCVFATVNNSVSDCGSCFRINITEDSDSEPTEQFIISFTVKSVQPEGVNVNNFSEAIIYIRDDDGKNHYWASLCEIIEGQQ